MSEPSRATTHVRESAPPSGKCQGGKGNCFPARFDTPKHAAPSPAGRAPNSIPGWSLPSIEWTRPPLPTESDVAAALQTIDRLRDTARHLDIDRRFSHRFPVLAAPTDPAAPDIKSPLIKGYRHSPVSIPDMLAAFRRRNRGGFICGGMGLVVVDIDSGGDDRNALLSFLDDYRPLIVLPSGKRNRWHCYFAVAIGTAAAGDLKTKTSFNVADFGGGLGGDVLYTGNYTLVHHWQWPALAAALSNADRVDASRDGGRRVCDLLRAGPSPRAAPARGKRKPPADSTAQSTAAPVAVAKPTRRATPAPCAIPNGWVTVTHAPPDLPPRLLVMPARFQTAPAGDGTGRGRGQMSLYHLDKRTDFYNAVHNHHRYGPDGKPNGIDIALVKRGHERALYSHESGWIFGLNNSLFFQLAHYNGVAAALRDRALLHAELDLLVLAVNLNAIAETPLDDDELNKVVKSAWARLRRINPGDITRWRAVNTRQPDWTHRPDAQARKGRLSGQARRFSRADNQAQAKLLYADGARQAEIARALDTTQQTISRWLRAPLTACDTVKSAACMHAPRAAGGLGMTIDAVAAALDCPAESVALWMRALAIDAPPRPPVLTANAAPRLSPQSPPQNTHEPVHSAARPPQNTHEPVHSVTCCRTMVNSVELTESTEKVSTPRDSVVNSPGTPGTRTRPETFLYKSPRAPLANAPTPVVDAHAAAPDRALPPPPSPDNHAAPAAPQPPADAARAAPSPSPRPDTPRQAALFPPPSPDARPPDAPRRGRPRTQPQTCTAPDCTARPVSKSLCMRHYQARRRAAAAATPPLSNSPPGHVAARPSPRGTARAPTPPPAPDAHVDVVADVAPATPTCGVYPPPLSDAELDIIDGSGGHADTAGAPLSGDAIDAAPLSPPMPPPALDLPTPTAAERAAAVAAAREANAINNAERKARRVSPPPTDKQLRYLHALSKRAGVTTVTPSNRADASARIKRLLAGEFPAAVAITAATPPDTPAIDAAPAAPQPPAEHDAERAAAQRRRELIDADWWAYEMYMHNRT